MKKIKFIFVAMALLVSTLALGQSVTVTGKVTDSTNGEAVPFASIQLKGTMTGANTDLDGNYSISVPSGATLIFSSIGYTSTEVAVGSRNVINVSLVPDSEFLDETIVVAYGTATKSSFTGSATVVKTEEIEKQIATNVTSALAGTTAGVQMISSSGDPASNGSSIRIRGIGSMSASNSPLIVVDGAPYEGSISDINPNDVESMSVLKDAAASAIYGARGANGVILITTKRGNKGGDAQVKFDARFGSNSRLIPNYDVITDPAQYYETVYRLLYNKAYYANGNNAEKAYATADKQILNSKDGGLGYLVYTYPEGQKFIGTNFKLNPNATLGYSDGTYYYTPDNWYDEVYHNSFRQEYNVSVNGHSDRFNYYASAGYLDDKGVISNSDYQRYSARLNAEYQVKKWMKINTNMSYTHSKSISVSGAGSWGSSGNLFYITNNIGPIYPLYVRDASGNIMKDEGGRTLYDANQTGFSRPGFMGNAVRDNEYDSANNLADVLTGKWGVVLTPVKGLSVSANISLTDDNTRYNSLSSIFGSGTGTDGSAYVSHSRMFATNKQLIAEYKTNFGGTDHSLDVLAGYEDYSRMSQGLSAENTHLFNPTIGEINNAKGEPADKSISSSTTRYRSKGFLSRAQYEYAGRYFASVSFRRDASSRFAPGHQWGSFGSIGAAWLISEEPFMASASWLDMLKLKLSYGVQGNDGIGSYSYTDTYSATYSKDAGYAVFLTAVGNKDLTWETSKNFNVGFDFELFKNRLNGSFEVFSRKTEDLLYSRPVPNSAGNPAGVLPVNVGSILNNGFEVTLDGAIIRTRNVNWSWNANFSHYKNTILDLDPAVRENGIKGSNYIYKVGGSLYEAYMRQWAGVNPENGKAQYYYDVKKKGEDGTEIVTKEITEDFSKATQYECGSTLPKLYGGFGTSVNFWNFDFSAQLSYQLGGRFYDGAYQNLMWTQNQAGSAMHKDMLLAWTEENPNSDIPRLDGDYSVAQTTVDRFFISSNYLSLNNVTLGYTVPAKFIKKLDLSALRIYVAGENLCVLSARKGVDPRFSQGLNSFTSASNSNYSSMRSVIGGITLTF